MAGRSCSRGIFWHDRNLIMKKIFYILISVFVLGAAFMGYRYFTKNKASNTIKEGYILIPRNANLKQVVDSLKPFLRDQAAFMEVAEKKILARSIKPGRYQIKTGDDNTRIVNMIKAGLQVEDQFRIKDFDNVYQMVGRVSRKLESDSLQMVNSFNNIAKSKGLQTAEDLKPYFFADTYQFFWTTSPEEFFSEFEKDYNSFWDASHVAQEKKLGLNRAQVYALASIVHKESGGKKDEQKTIAGLYLNRLKKGMKLQSDPTVIYALNQKNNFSKVIKRVYYKDLLTPSPYNTYTNVGLPPGPICVVPRQAVESILNAEPNSYIFMCADPKRFGYHKFTANEAEHAKNAEEYRRWLDSKKIK